MKSTPVYIYCMYPCLCLFLQMKAQFDLDAKLLIGCKTDRSAKACQLLVDAGFTQVHNVESQIFMRTRAPQVWS